MSARGSPARGADAHAPQPEDRAVKGLPELGPRLRGGVRRRESAPRPPLPPQRGRPTGSWSQSVALAVAFSDAAPAAPASARTATAAARTATGAADRRAGIVAARRAGGLAAGRSTSMFANFEFVKLEQHLGQVVNAHYEDEGAKKWSAHGVGRAGGGGPFGKIPPSTAPIAPQLPREPPCARDRALSHRCQQLGRPLLRVGGGAGAGAPRRAVPDYGYVQQRGRPTNAATSRQCNDRLKRSSACSKS